MIWTFEHISMFQTRKSMIKPSQIHLQLRRKQTSLEDGMQYSHTKPTCTNSGSQALVLPPPGVHCRITKFTSPQNTNQLDHLQSSNVQNTELLEMVCESKKKKNRQSRHSKTHWDAIFPQHRYPLVFCPFAASLEDLRSKSATTPALPRCRFHGGWDRKNRWCWDKEQHLAKWKAGKILIYIWCIWYIHKIHIHHTETHISRITTNGVLFGANSLWHRQRRSTESCGRVGSNSIPLFPFRKLFKFAFSAYFFSTTSVQASWTGTSGRSQTQPSSSKEFLTSRAVSDGEFTKICWFGRRTLEVMIKKTSCQA